MKITTSRIIKGLSARPPTGQQAGFSLTEALVAVAIVSVAIIMLVSSLSTGSRAVGILYDETTAENLARAQLEYTKSQAYIPAPASYEIIPSLPAGFTVSADASAVAGRDGNIQKITITILRNDRRVLSLEDYKVDR